MSAPPPGPPPPPAVVVAGDALVDLTPTAALDGGPAYRPHPGGSCLNVAVGLGRLGVPTGFLGRLSDDHFGAGLRAHLADSDVQLDLVVPTTDLTTLAIVHLVDGQARYSIHAAAAADRGLRPEHLDALPGGGALPDGAALHLGSIALVLEPVATTLEGLLQRESRQRLVSLDPNVRPALVPDRAAYLRRWAHWMTLVDVVKLSAEDLAWLHPDDDEPEAVAGWLAAGVSLVLVTDGDRGARATTLRATAAARAQPVEVVDTVGAGDAFMAGALAHLHDEGMLRREAVRDLDATGLEALLGAATGVAALTCTRAGADPPRRTRRSEDAG